MNSVLYFMSYSSKSIKKHLKSSQLSFDVEMLFSTKSRISYLWNLSIKVDVYGTTMKKGNTLYIYI